MSSSSSSSSSSSFIAPLNQDLKNLSLSPNSQTQDLGCSVHKSCVEVLPKHVRNMLHPAHLLELSTPHSFRCDACREDHHLECSYQCKSCNFELDTNCVLEQTFEEPHGHSEHAYEIMKPTRFTCDACGLKEYDRVSCVCTACQMQVHKKCSSSFPSFPLSVKDRRHRHKLKLTYSFQLDSDLNLADKICKTCFSIINNVLCVYYCAECAYITHLTCGVLTNAPDDENEEISSPCTMESNELHQKQQQIDHFSHPHSLLLNSVDEPKDDTECDGCATPITVPFYTCDHCNFFLHQHCVELPINIQHPLHFHDLTLTKMWDRDIKVDEYYHKRNVLGFMCRGCRHFCDGLVYTCEVCEDYFLDIGCSLLPDNLHHEGHACGALTLIDSRAGDPGRFELETKCSACGVDCSIKFVCEKCKFELDLQCASLPKRILHECPKHGWNKHPFKLTYHTTDDGSGEYYCDECEERRDEKHWFYYCEDCKYSAHPSCLLGYHRTRYGGSYQIREHPHLVELVKKPWGNWNHNCQKCKKPLEKNVPVLSCIECKIYFHSLGDCCSFVD